MIRKIVTPSPSDDAITDNPLVMFVARSYGECISLMVAKNHDYAGDDDPLANFRFAEKMGLTTSDGILLRLLDKVARLCSIHQSGVRMVTDETIRDTVNDICNYAQIYAYEKEA